MASSDGKRTDDESLFGLFETQCKLTPKRIALKSTELSCTYEETLCEVKKLNTAMSTYIFTYPGDCMKSVIAMYLPSSVAYVIAMLAVLKCGSVLLPVSIDCPNRRLAFMLKDANARILLMTEAHYGKCNQRCLSEQTKEVLRCRVANENIVVVQLLVSDAVDQYSEPSPGSIVTDQVSGRHELISTDCSLENHDIDTDACYIMYTSGSTGKPKGVQIQESSVVNLAKAQIKLWDLGPTDTIAQFSNIGFDASISEIFTAMLSGASLAIFDATEKVGNGFICAMNKLEVSVITLVPSVLKIYSPGHFPHLRKVISAGEMCTFNTAIKWTAHSTLRFFNAYGPTETSVCAACYEHNRESRCEDASLPLPVGRAIDGVAVYVLDEEMNPAPPNAVGEIFIGGKGVAQGYIGHASRLNSAKFVPHPLYLDMPLYRTGDTAAMDENGVITLIGRKDHQIKIRGQRVDLDEIEQVLAQHPEVELSVVVVHKCSMSSEVNIAAFVSPVSICPSDVRQYLSDVLPQCMIPTFIKQEEVSALPRTTNGKVDRHALAADETVHEQIHHDGQCPLNETQRLVARCMVAVLKLEEIPDTQSSFGALGGNSLQLVLLLRLIDEELNVTLSCTDLGTKDTIEAFSDAIILKKNAPEQSMLPALKSGEDLRNMILEDSKLDSECILVRKLEKPESGMSSRSKIIVQESNWRLPKNVLISGVTGFLGAFLLSELLEQSDAAIWCMVRDSTEERGTKRVVANLRRYGLWRVHYLSRIKVVISDLSKERVGIAAETYSVLANTIDTIFMNAAQMNVNNPYEYHRMTNVEGTKQLIEFAFTGVQKHLFSISSLGVFLFPCASNGNERCTFSESDSFKDPLMVHGGYGQSKWASERLVRQALEFLPAGAIFRPGRITGRSTDGTGPKDDLFTSTLLGMKRIGSYPDVQFPYDLTPVDFCAKAVVEIALATVTKAPVKNNVYHLFNKNTLQFTDLFKDMGLRALGLEEWRRQLRETAGGNEHLILFEPFFNSSFWELAPTWPLLDNTNTDRAISDDTKACLPSSAGLLKTYKTFLGL